MAADPGPAGAWRPASRSGSLPVPDLAIAVRGESSGGFGLVADTAAHLLRIGRVGVAGEATDGRVDAA